MAPDTYPFSKSDKFTVIAKLGKFWWASGIFSFFVCLCGIGALVWVLLFSGKLSSTSAIVFFVLMVIAVLLYAIYIIAAVLRTKLEVDKREIRVYKAFKIERIAINQIEGFCAEQGSKTAGVRLLCSSISMHIELIFEHRQAFLNWLGIQFENLDEKVQQEAMEQIKNDAKLGVDSEQRVKAVESGQQLVRYLIFSGLGLFYWGLIYPKPYELVIGLLLFVALLAFILPNLNGIKVKWDGSDNDHFGKTFVLIIPAASVLGIRALNDWSILSWSAFWLPFGISILCLLALYIISIKEAKLFSGATLINGVFFIGLSAGTVVVFNGILPQEPAKIYQTTIENKAKGLYVTLAPWPLQLESIEVEVSKKKHSAVEVGDVVNVRVYPGAFGMPYYLWRLADIEKQ